MKWQCLEPLGLSGTRAGQGLGVARQALSELVNGRTAVSEETAIRLSKALGSTPTAWLGMQLAHVPGQRQPFLSPSVLAVADYAPWRMRADALEVERLAAA